MRALQETCVDVLTFSAAARGLSSWMLRGIDGTKQQSATCTATVARLTQQATRRAACCPHQCLAGERVTRRRSQPAARCDQQGYHEGGLSWPHGLKQHAQSAAVATASVSVCQESQQQVFLSSSGMQSSLLHMQQQQVTQLLHASPQTCNSHVTLELQQQHRKQHVAPHHHLHCQQDVSNPHSASSPGQVILVSSYHVDDHQQQQYHLQPGIAWHLDVKEQLHDQQQHKRQADADISLQQQQHHVEQIDRRQRLLLLRHPAQFTGWIKHSSSLEELQQLCDLHGHRLNPINLSAALVQLGRLFGGGQGSSGADAAQRLALQLAHKLQQQLGACDSARQVANASWALAVMQCSVPVTLLQQTAEQVSAGDARLLRASQPQELATLAWAFGKLRLDPCDSVWLHLTAALQQHQQLDRLKSQELAMLFWALADRHERQQELLQAVPMAVNGRHQGQRHVQPTRGQNNDLAAAAPAPVGTQAAGSWSAGCRNSLDTVQSSSSSSKQKNLGLRTLLPRLSAIIQQQLQQGRRLYTSQDLSLLLWSMAVLKFADLPLLHMLGTQLQQHAMQGRCNSQDISNSLWAMSKLQVDYSGLLAAAVQTADSWLRQCSTHEVLLLLYACAALAGSQPTAATVVQHQHAADLWQQATSELQQRLAAGQQLGPAELTTLLQSVERTLQGMTKCSKGMQQVQGPFQPSSAAGSHDNSSSSSNTSSTEGSSSFEDSDSLSSSCEDVADAAWALLGVVYDRLVLHPDLVHSLGCRHVACALSAVASISERHQHRPPGEIVIALFRAARAAAMSMNHQQLCMTAWAAAKLAPSHTADDSTLLLMDTLQQGALHKLPRMQPQQLSIMAWAHARLWNLGDSLLLHELAKAAMKQLHKFGPQALSNLTWAFARARHYDGALTAALARRGRALLGEFSPAELSNLAWGLVTLGYRQQGFLRAVATHVAAHSSSWDAKACTKLAEAFSHEGVPVQRFRGLFYALGDTLADKPRSLLKLTVHELGQLAVAFSVARVRHKQLIGHVAAAAVQRLDRMAVVDIVRLVSAVASLHQRHDGLLGAVSARVAAEMAWKSEVGAGTGNSDSNSAAASTCQSAGSATVASSASSLANTKLQPQHLSRLAWAYRTLGHEDSGWYLAAAQHMSDVRGEAKQYQQQYTASNCTSRSSFRSNSPRHIELPSSSVSASSLSAGDCGPSTDKSHHHHQQRADEVSSQVRQGRPGDNAPRSMLSIAGRDGVSAAVDSTQWGVLKRPVHRPDGVSSATVLVHVGQQNID